MKCEGCVKQKKADNCIKCKKDLELKLESTLSVVEEIKIIAEGSTNTNMIIKKIDQLLKEESIPGCYPDEIS